MLSYTHCPRHALSCCVYIAVTLFLFYANLQVANAQAYDYRIEVIGPSSMYAGSDAYFQLNRVTVNPPQHAKFFYSATLSGAPVTYSVSCRNGTCPMDALGRYFDLGIPILRISISASKTPGLYSVDVKVESEGITKFVKIPLRVLAPAIPVPKPSYLASLPIPGLTKWQTVMTTVGSKCDPRFDYGTFTNEGTDWFYDGARVYFQIGDYTSDRSWDGCALNIARQYRDHVISMKGKLNGYRIFTRGLRMAYERTGDAKYRDAVFALADGAGYVHYELSVDEATIRENSYAVNALIDAERLGRPRSPHLLRLVNYIIGHYDRLFVQKKYTLHQTFFDGLAAEALIDYYDLTGDPRIPPTIKLMLDWLWDYGWNKSTYQMVYNPDPVGPTCSSGCRSYFTDLINLVAPAYAWYWRVTGDTVYQQRGDELFAHALDTAIAPGKLFSQNYHWSPDYVRWRTVDQKESCLYTLTSSTTAIPASGLTLSVQVVARPDCPWSTKSDVSWASFSSSQTAGSGTAKIAVSQNTGTSVRTGTVRIGNQTVTITQAAALPTALAGGSDVSNRSVDVPVTQYGIASGLGTAVAGNTSLRIETRFHNWSLSSGGNSRGTVGLTGFKLFWERDQPNVICQAPYDGVSANSVKLPVSGRSDFLVRCQRDVANNRITGEIWNADGSGYFAGSAVITKWAATLNLNYVIFGRSSGEVANATFRVGFLRVFSTTKPLTIAPIEGSERGNIANYEFENNTDDTSGNGRHLKMNTTPVFFDTAAGATRRSIVVPLTLYGSAPGLGLEAPGNTPVRIEARIHNWSLATGGNSRGTLGLQGFRLVWEQGQPNVICQAPYDGVSVNSVKLPVSGRSDFLVRCQRDVANNRITGEIWNADGSGYFAGSAVITKWAQTLNLNSIVFARWSWEAPNAVFHAGFYRISNTIKPLGAPLSETTGVGNIANYEFDNDSKDTSGNNRHLTVNVTPAFAATPGN